MHARHYNLHLGRFLSVDPIGGSIGSSQSWNRYAYVRGNPLRMVDPLGLSDRDINGRTGGCDQDSTAGDQPCFEGEIAVTAPAPRSDLPWLACQGGGCAVVVDGVEQRSINLSAPEGVGIMARLAQQPPVKTGTDVLKSMSSFQCDTTWNRVFQNMATTNSLGLKGPGGFSLYGARNAAVDIGGVLTRTNVATELGLPTIRNFILGGGFRGMVIDGVSYTGLEAGVLSGAAVGAELTFTSVAWESGVLVGSVLNVAATAPCHYAR